MKDVDLPPLSDPLQGELARHQRELANAQARLLKQLRQVKQAKGDEEKVRRELAKVTIDEMGQNQKKTQLENERNRRQAESQRVALSLDEIRRRSKRVLEQIQLLEKRPRRTHQLHYRTPVSAPVESEEMMFECRHGRVTFVDMAAMLTQIERGLEDKGRQLKTQWEVDDVTAPVGAFRLRYSVARVRGPLDAVVDDSLTPSSGSYRYGVNAWRVEPVVTKRGETEEVALSPNSEFRQIVDALDPRQSVVTIFVYPDSFALFRRLRDYLYDRDIVVAGRPLPLSMPMCGSRQGSRSRGQ
jgi:hypothetical protein